MGYYLNVNNQQFGPYSFEQIDQFLLAGKIDAKTPIWRQDLAAWLSLGQLGEFQKAGSPPAPSTVSPEPVELMENFRPSGESPAVMVGSANGGQSPGNQAPVQLAPISEEQPRMRVTPTPSVVQPEFGATFETSTLQDLVKSLPKPVLFGVGALPLVVYLVFFYHASPKVTQTALSPVDLTAAPVLEPIEANAIVVDDGDLEKITPKVDFVLNARLMGTKDSNDDGFFKDLMLIHGELTQPQYQDHIEYSSWVHQVNFKTNEISRKQVTEYMTNIHVRPKTKNLRRALQHLEGGQDLGLRGKLVFLTIDNKEYPTSTVFGDNWCEYLLLEELQVGNKIYR